MIDMLQKEAGVDEELIEFFKSHGYSNTWDCNRGNYWHEFYLDKELKYQIGFGITLDILREEFKNFSNKHFVACSKKSWDKLGDLLK